MLASLVGFLGDFDLAEEATADAFATAAERWPVQGTPPNPGGWLTTTAKRRAIDLIRRRGTLAEKTKQLAVSEESTEDDMDEIENPPMVIADERLELIFMCCHPALAREAQVALTLRALGGLSTEEIARAFLVGEETMKRRLSRAKAKIKATRIPFAVPADHLLPDRLQAVLVVIYLVYNEGYGGGRVDLAAEAIQLGRLLAELMPDEPEAHGLLALMLSQHARRAARFDARGDLVLLSDQDRSLWNTEMIAAGRRRLDRAIGLHGRGAFVMQAAIDSVQIAPSPDWDELSDLYARLVELTGSPVVKLNHAVAIAQAGDPERALVIVDALDLEGYPYLHSTRGELLARLGRVDEAKAAFGAALERVWGEPERRFLQRRIDRL
ncbi:MAG: sigma-70 family RNA polymerase sigma factor [Actinomycetota bacterium]|nr:sigma-70 family RNA polymerase sigma factor [Actinomycetota bacterium]